jgi:hypothetical protein
MTFGYWVHSRYGEKFKIGTEVQNLDVVTSVFDVLTSNISLIKGKVIPLQA